MLHLIGLVLFLGAGLFAVHGFAELFASWRHLARSSGWRMTRGAAFAPGADAPCRPAIG